MDGVVDGVSAGNRENVLNSMVREGFAFLCVLVFPAYVMLMCTMLPQIEYRNNTWKQVFASPQTMFNIFMSRFINVQLLILLFLFLYNLFLGLAAVGIHFMEPSLGIFSKSADWTAVMSNNLNVYLAILAISAFQFWMGLRFRNFIVSLGIGVALWIVGSVMVMEFRTPYAEFFPYTYLAFTIIPKHEGILTYIQLGSVGYMVLFLLLAFLDFRRRRGMR